MDAPILESDDTLFHNTTSLSHLTPNNKVVVDAVVEEYKEFFGRRLVSVYVFGSAIREGSSDERDIDDVAIISKEEEADKNWANEKEVELSVKFSKSKGVDVKFITRVELSKNAHWQAILKLDGRVVYGEDLLAKRSLPADYKELALAKYGRYLTIIPDLIKQFENDSMLTEETILWATSYLSKIALRLGLALSMIDYKQYSEVPKNQMRLIKKYYPEYSEVAELAYKFRYDGSKSKKDLLKLISLILPFYDFAKTKMQY